MTLDLPERGGLIPLKSGGERQRALIPSVKERRGRCVDGRRLGASCVESGVSGAALRVQRGCTGATLPYQRGTCEVLSGGLRRDSAEPRGAGQKFPYQTVNVFQRRLDGYALGLGDSDQSV